MAAPRLNAAISASRVAGSAPLALPAWLLLGLIVVAGGSLALWVADLPLVSGWSR